MDDHEAAQDKAEASVFGAVRKAVRGFAGTARRAILRGRNRLPDTDLWPDPNMWAGLVGDLVMPVVGRIHKDWYTEAVVEETGGTPGRDGLITVDGARPLIFNPAAAFGAYQAKVVDRLNNVAYPIATLDRVREVIADGMSRGESPEVITVAVEAVLEREPGEIRTIATTEAIAATNDAQQAAYRDLSNGLRVMISKTWISMRDEGVRATHRAADGQTVDVATPYLVGGVPLMYPADPTGPAREVINCRCYSKYQIRRP